MPDQHTANLSQQERRILLQLARDAVVAAAHHSPLPQPKASTLPAVFTKKAACFVTLRQKGSHELRGCTGVLTAQRPLFKEVIRSASHTALYDPRFSPVAPHEVDGLDIEVSVLTAPAPLAVPRPDDLPQLIRPGVDGVTLHMGGYRATFLPQVWETIPDPVEFLDRLCEKMGLYPNAWRHPGMEVEVYQAEGFSESELAEG